MADDQIIRLEGLFLRHEDQLAYGPLNLDVKPGQGALVLVNDLELMRRLMRCCLGLEKPEAGRISWWSEAGSVDDNHWDLYDFYRRIGYVDRVSQLIGALSLLENLGLYYLYAGENNGLALALARRVLDLFGLAGYEHLRADDLPEPQRRLGLYALAFAQKPRLMLMERPSQFLDRDFDQVWDRILKRAANSGLAYIVFDRTRIPYNQDHFSAIQTLKPGRL